MSDFWGIDVNLGGSMSLSDSKDSDKESTPWEIFLRFERLLNEQGDVIQSVANAMRMFHHTLYIILLHFWQCASCCCE